ANGSANLCELTDKVYAEDRVVFFDDPEVSKAFAQEFARLWELYGEPAYGTITPEKLDNSRINSDVRIVFTSLKDKPRAMTVDKLLEKTLDQVDSRRGTIDIALFAYTHYGITQKLLQMAEAMPKVKIRILLDHSQLRSEGDKKGLMSEYLEREIRARRLKNIEIRYKFRANAYGFDKEAKQNMLVHVRSYLMHHKCLFVNRRYLVTGSYNWSESASERNLEM
ncbi:MAG TPA: phospholipase D-like domain-containing protein, partial [Candidatus Ozemobacteraceae bacterium]|nr:phospholipase D-like domain-containing protein [Candidatus Ozemobacteraceae bacterium]